ncbi:MAG: hypothetical protein LKI94_01615 [Sporolactobacillus sp.]|jgi:flagellar protein FliT|nr:hypothetical protein [Sporolactobacillus sp.]
MCVQKIYEATLKLRKLVELQAENNGAANIQEIKDQLDLRQQLIDRLPKILSDNDKALGRKIVALNVEIDHLMNKMKDKLIHKMKMFKHQKESLIRYRGYSNPLLTQSGTYFDRHE